MRLFEDWDATAKLIQEAHAAKITTSGHIALPLPLIAAGIDGMEHLGPSGVRTDEIIYEDIMRLFKAAGIWVVPTAVAYSSVVRVGREVAILDSKDVAPFLTPFLRWWNLRLPPDRQPSYERFARLTRLSMEKLHRAGVLVAAGSDTELPWAIHWELEEMVSSGMSPLQAIAAATGLAACVLGASKDIGTIKLGKIADLVILDADPLQDIRNTRKIWRIIQGGQVIQNEKTDQ
jgi:hypothetical protein